MKQSELNKLVHAELKQSAKARNWKFSRGFVFKATDQLFFSIIILGQIKRRCLSYWLSYKLLAFDPLFWKIVNLEENLKRPLSFRAAGAWTAPMSTISRGELSIADWNPKNLQLQMNEILSRCEFDADRISKEIRGLDDNLRVIERLYMNPKTGQPNTVTNIWCERLLTSILKNEYDSAQRIIRDRMIGRDPGGFQVGSKSFYELANEYLRAMPAQL